MNEPNPTQGEASQPNKQYDEMPLHETLRRGVKEMGYTEPTPIQAKTIPQAVLGTDIIGTAQTGSGKTAAFLLPILERLLREPTGRIYALVLTPTRELALQAETFLKKLGRHTHLKGAAVYGGVGMEPQQRALRGGAEIIIATPGRLLDHMSRGYVDLRHLRILVLDEADRMLDMGFIPDVRDIVGRLPRNRQTMLFSATMPPEIVRLSREFLNNPRMIRMEEKTVAAAGVSHRAILVEANRKTSILSDLLRQEGMDSVLVFTKTKHRADRLSFQLQKMGVRAGVIHGDKSQSQRVRALEAFRNGSQRVLIATDIAARGIDVEGISHVINYDVPHEAATYVHRVGRTARAQKEGDAISLVSREEQDDFDRIEQFIGMAIARENKTDPNAAPQAPMGRFSQPRHRPGVRPPPRHRYQHKF